MAIPDAYRAVSLGEFNVGAAAAVGLLNPLAAQIDGLIALGLGPFQASLNTQFNAALAAQMQLSIIGVNDTLAALKASIAAVVSLQASLQAALALGLPPISLGAEIGAQGALALTLKAQLAGLQGLIRAALAAKVPAIQGASALGGALSAGPFFAVSFSGVQLQAVSSWLASEVAAGGLSADSQVLASNEQTFGVLVFGTNPSFQAAFGAIIAVPT